jgi:hypothetical protein
VSFVVSQKDQQHTFMNCDTRPYSGFEIISETNTDGWFFGAITVYGGTDCSCPPSGCVSGDGFVEAPDGSRAGIVWSVGELEEPFRISEPEQGRWGVFEVPFERPVKTIDDLIYCFRKVLPYLQKEYESTIG